MELDIPDMFPASPFIRQQRSRRKRPDCGAAPRYLHYDASECLRLLCYQSYPQSRVCSECQCQCSQHIKVDIAQAHAVTVQMRTAP